MTKKEIHTQKRKQLQALSQIAKVRMHTDLEGCSVNEILVQHFYTDKQNYIFHTFHDWIKKDYKINKGAEAFLIWGKPKNKLENKEIKTENTTEETEREFYPMCYLFSNAQVTKKQPIGYFFV